MATTSGVRLPHVLAIVGVVAAIALVPRMLMPGLSITRESAVRIRCRNNLNQMAKGMATYLNEVGDNRFYPFPLGRGRTPDDFNGAEWLATLYWTRLVEDPKVFLCPMSGDANRNGRDLGLDRVNPDRFGSQAVSYAGMHYRSLADRDGKPRAIPSDMPPSEVMACDDTEGTVNHPQSEGRGMSVLFFDSHVEYWTNTRVDIETGVGVGDLCALRN